MDRENAASSLTLKKAIQDDPVRSWEKFISAPSELFGPSQNVRAESAQRYKTFSYQYVGAGSADATSQGKENH